MIPSCHNEKRSIAADAVIVGSGRSGRRGDALRIYSSIQHYTYLFCSRAEEQTRQNRDGTRYIYIYRALGPTLVL